MLQQILKEMYVDPDVLNALNEDQKKTLFLKMRQEQVRRWKEREEKLDKEGGDAEFKRTKPKKAKSKNVSWLLGRDGDVAVIVIGEVDELSSKFICSGLGEKKTPSLQNNTNHQTILKSKKPTEPDKTERENLVCNTQPGISLNFKGKHEETSTLLPLPVSVGEHSTPPAAEKPESKSARATEEKSVTQTPICSRSPARVNPINIRPALSNVTPVSVNTRPSVANLKQAAAAATTSTAVLHSPPSTTVKKDSTTAPTKSGPSSQAPQKPQAPQGGNGVSVSAASRKAASQEAGSSGSAPTCTGRGRVAQLMKTFSAESTTTTTPNTQTPAKGIKPPLPTKPSHLRVTTTPTIR